MKSFFILVGLFLAVLFQACSGGKLLSEADQAFSRGEYFSAIEKYKEANQKEKDAGKKSHIAFMMAKSYLQTGNYAPSAAWYKNAIRRGNDSIETRLDYCDVLRAAEKLEDMEAEQEELSEIAPDNPRLENSLLSGQLIQQWGKLPPVYFIDPLKTLNSSGDEQSVAILPGNVPRIAFASSSEKASGKEINPVTGQKFADIFIARYDSARSSWSFPEKLGDSLKINTEANELAFCIDQKNELAVFARADYMKGQKMIPRLYAVQREKGAWSMPVLIPFSDDGASYFDPVISPDGKYLFFASDRVGGLGKTDIWKSELQNGTFSEPVNMGTKINTPGKERSPFMKENGHLYFSSDYHPGVGGLDIFQATSDLNGKWEVENMSTPVNSPDDDFDIVFYPGQEKGFFSSSRRGSHSRSVDLYSFYSPPRLFQCFGHVRNFETDSVIDNVNVRIVGTDGTSLLLKTNKGDFHAELKPEADYAIMVFKKGYLNAQAKISTKGMRTASEFKLDFKQTPTDKPIIIENINYESGKWNLLPEVKRELDKLVDVLAINPNITVEIMSHTDDIGEAAFNRELSQKRAEEVIRYLESRGGSSIRLHAKGYGESLPFTVRMRTAKQYPFLQEGEILTPQFIGNLPSEKEQEIARRLNRRTEFRVVN